MRERTKDHKRMKHEERKEEAKRKWRSLTLLPRKEELEEFNFVAAA